jgi:rubrerythrin
LSPVPALPRNIMEDKLNLLGKLGELGISVCRLYETYAIIFPDFKDFWSGLAIEEKQHAEWMRELQSLVLGAKADFRSGNFNVFAIQAFINYINNKLKMVNQNDMTLLNALAISQYIEDSVIESKYFEVITGDALEIKQILNSLADATKNHNNRVKETLVNYKNTLDKS